MPPSADLSALYARPVILWVEDLVSSTYLHECWQDADIAFRIAGGVEGVRTLVRSAQEEGFGHVFGFVDRDFGATNRPFWHDPSRSAIFVPDIHEAENYMLQADHLAGCALNNGRRAVPEIEVRLHTCAASMVWWMACRRVLSDLRSELLNDFPSHSRIATQAEAEHHICASGWYHHLRDYYRTVLPASEISRRLAEAHVPAAAALTDGTWRQKFSGKELLRDLHHWLYTPPPGGATTAAERDRDLARAVARWQAAHGAVPAEVQELRAALRGRVGI